MILYDLTALQSQGNVKMHGGGTFAYFVFMRMIELHVPFSAFYDSSKYINPQVLQLANREQIALFDIAKFCFHNMIGKVSNPLVFSILPKPYMFEVQVIGTIHDCRELELENDFWEFFYGASLKVAVRKLFCCIFKRWYFSRQLRKLEQKISNRNFIPTTITYYSKYKLIQNFPYLNLSKMPVFSTPFTLSSVVSTNETKNNFFLFVSGDRWLKNVLRGIVALDNLFSAGYLPNFYVIVTGMNSLSQYHYKIKNKERFKCVGYVEDEQLQTLYKTAFAFIFPSLNEGFGIPPLEAMKYGTPVIASNKTAIPEVCGDAAIYIDPFSKEDIESKILMLTNEPKIYRELQHKGYERYVYMSRKSLKELDNYIDFVINNNEKNNNEKK